MSVNVVLSLWIVSEMLVAQTFMLSAFHLVLKLPTTWPTVWSQVIYFPESPGWVCDEWKSTELFMKMFLVSDPAFPLFVFSNKEHKLDSSDAKFVDVFHCNVSYMTCLNVIKTLFVVSLLFLIFHFMLGLNAGTNRTVRERGLFHEWRNQPTGLYRRGWAWIMCILGKVCSARTVFCLLSWNFN